jgi:hypothetical protein
LITRHFNFNSDRLNDGVGGEGVDKVLPVSSGIGSASASGGDDAQGIASRRVEHGEGLVSGVKNKFDGFKVVFLGNGLLKGSSTGNSHAKADEPSLRRPDAVGEENGARNTVVVQVVKVAILRDRGARVVKAASTGGRVGSALEGRQRIKESGSVDVGVVRNVGKLVGQEIETQMTSQHIAETNLTGGVGTSLDGVEEEFVVGILRKDGLRSGGHREDGDGMRREQRTNSKVDFTAVGINLDPEVVAASLKTAVVDDDGIFSILGSVDGTSRKRDDVGATGVTVAGAGS